MDILGLTQEAAAERVGLQRSTIANHIRLLELPKQVQDALADGLIQMGHARALLGLASKDAQIELLQEAVRDDLTVRDVERVVRSRSSIKSGKATVIRRKDDAIPAWALEFENRLRDALGTKVHFETRAKFQGRIVIRGDDAQMRTVVLLQFAHYLAHVNVLPRQ
jgi:ParB family chromosome partitioning protein